MIAVAGGKGGCGKTTTTLGVARALPGVIHAIEGDWDLPNLHTLAGTPREPSQKPSQKSPRKPSRKSPRKPSRKSPRKPPRKPPQGLHPPAHSDPETGGEARPGGHRTDGNVRIVPPPIDCSGSDQSHHLDRLRERAGHSIATTLVDCPSGAGPDAAAPLSIADRSLLVTTLSPPALRDTAKTAAMARQLDAPPVGVVVTRTETVPDGLSAFLSTPVLGTVPAVRPPVIADSQVRAAYRTIADALQQAIGVRDADTETPQTPTEQPVATEQPTATTPSSSETRRMTAGGRAADIDPANWSYPR